VQDEQALPQPRTKQRPLTKGRAPRTVKKAAPSQANKQAMDALKKRMEEDRRATKAGVVPENTPPPSPSPARHTAVPGTAVKAPASVVRPQSAVKMQSTPGTETSVLALQNFRRRPRQPSLLQMVQNPDLAATQIDDTTDFTLGSLGDEDDFAPHDEGTPLQLSKGKEVDVAPEPEGEVEQEQEQDRAQTPPPPPAATADDDDEFYGATPQKSTQQQQRQTRKRKSDALEESEIQVFRSSPSLPSPSRSLPDYNAIPATAAEDSHGDDEEAAAATMTASQQGRLVSDTYADPLSSSPPPPEDAISSPNSPAMSPSALRKSSRSGAGGPTVKKIKPLTTATLRAMLPKRRNQRRDEFDFSSSSHDVTSSAFEEEKRKRAKRTKKAVASKKTPQAAAAAAAATCTVKAAKKPTTSSRTYTRNNANIKNNKENKNPIHISSASASPHSSSSPSSPLSSLDNDVLAEGEEEEETADTSLETIKGPNTTTTTRRKKNKDDEEDGKLSEELRKVREKFIEVDDWEMEFESASLGAGHDGDGLDSSPWR
jgi:hypothetical protein